MRAVEGLIRAVQGLGTATLITRSNRASRAPQSCGGRVDPSGRCKQPLVSMKCALLSRTFRSGGWTALGPGQIATSRVVWSCRVIFERVGDNRATKSVLCGLIGTAVDIWRLHHDDTLWTIRRQFVDCWRLQLGVRSVLARRRSSSGWEWRAWAWAGAPTSLKPPMSVEGRSCLAAAYTIHRDSSPSCRAVKSRKPSWSTVKVE